MMSRTAAQGWTMPFLAHITMVFCLAVATLTPASLVEGGEGVSGNLVIAGNGPEQAAIEQLTRVFEKANPRAYVDILWDENSKPVDLVKSGQAHIAVTGQEDAALHAPDRLGWDRGRRQPVKPYERGHVSAGRGHLLRKSEIVV
jgi:spermidine/putrescine-binding protein